MLSVGVLLCTVAVGVQSFGSSPVYGFMGEACSAFSQGIGLGLDPTLTYQDLPFFVGSL